MSEQSRSVSAVFKGQSLHSLSSHCPSSLFRQSPTQAYPRGGRLLLPHGRLDIAQAEVGSADLGPILRNVALQALDIHLPKWLRGSPGSQ